MRHFYTSVKELLRLDESLDNWVRALYFKTTEDTQLHSEDGDVSH